MYENSRHHPDTDLHAPRQELRSLDPNGRHRSADSLWTSLREQVAILFATWSMTRLIRRDLGLSGVRDMQGLIDAIAVKRNKPITVTQTPLPPEVSAFCARGRDRDFIVVDSNANELTRLHAELHELWHLWEEHPDDDATGRPMSETTVRQLLPGLKPGPVLQVLTRSHYDNAHERRAEAFATVMLQRHLQLRSDQKRTGFLASALTHRRSGV
ncbi:hypothetical protein V1460_16485 [Streptomyces sp. SCSIO 30461]|uniref:hypothetical protein n=1 Tax=Streptomyces sp. SCSIO 30461 TaxID=3118085 RepID=UPI0030CD211B